MVYLKLPPVHELDGVLGTKKWMVKKGESGASPFEKLDKKLGPDGSARKGRKVKPMEKKAGVAVATGDGEGNIDW